MTTLEKIQQVQEMQLTIDKMLEKGTMELNKPLKKTAGDVTKRWILQPLYEDKSCSVGLVHVPTMDLGQCETHVHPGSIEYLIVVKGKIMFNLEGRDMRIVREGEIAVVGVGQKHYSKPLTDDTSMVYVCVPRDSNIPAILKENTWYVW